MAKGGAYPPLFGGRFGLEFPLLTEVYLFGPLIAEGIVEGDDLLCTA
jgi:hypothetical protein